MTYSIFLTDSPAMLHNIYVTNKTRGVEKLYVCLRNDKVQRAELYSSDHVEMSANASASGAQPVDVEVGYRKKNEEKRMENKTFAHLVQGGFCTFKNNEPTPVAIEDMSKPTYLSVYDGNRMWHADFAVNVKRYGCISITESKEGIFVHPSNPKPKWKECEQGAPLSEVSTIDDKNHSFGHRFHKFFSF